MTNKNNSFSKLLTQKLPQVNGTHAILLVVIAGYIAWMAYQMVRNTLSGKSSMSMTTTMILVVIMGLISLLIFAYAAFIFYQSVKKDDSKESAEVGSDIPENEEEL